MSKTNWKDKIAKINLKYEEAIKNHYTDSRTAIIEAMHDLLEEAYEHGVDCEREAVEGEDISTKKRMFSKHDDLHDMIAEIIKNT